MEIQRYNQGGFMSIPVKVFADAFDTPVDVVGVFKSEIENECATPQEKREDGFVKEFHASFMHDKLQEAGYCLQYGWYLDAAGIPHQRKSSQKEQTVRVQVLIPISLKNKTSDDVIEAVTSCIDMSIEDVISASIPDEQKVDKVYMLPISLVKDLKRFSACRLKAKFIAVALQGALE